MHRKLRTWQIFFHPLHTPWSLKFDTSPLSIMSTLEEVSSFVNNGTEVTVIDEELDIEEQQLQTTFDISEIRQAIKVASEGALTGKTVGTYRRYLCFRFTTLFMSIITWLGDSLFKTFQKFVHSFESPQAAEAIIQPNASTPQLIAAWIFWKCDKANPLEPSTMECEGLSFSHALKMRAAISYHYAQDEERGSEKWHRDHHGTWLGNPALSHIVSRYMISLQRWKVPWPCLWYQVVCAFVNYEISYHQLFISPLIHSYYLTRWEVAMSHKVPVQLPPPCSQICIKKIWSLLYSLWADYDILRIPRTCIGEVPGFAWCFNAFIQLLFSVCWDLMKSWGLNWRTLRSWINLKDISNWHFHLGRLTNMEVYHFASLVFYKPEIKPFHLFFNHKEPHLDPVHHLLHWIHVSQLTAGPLFRRIDPYDRVVIVGNKALAQLS